MVKKMEYLLTVSKFREALREGKFLGLKCNQCGAYTVPPKKVCCECGSEDLSIKELNRNGKIMTGTVIYVTPKGYPTPTTVVLVELSDGPWVTANLINWNPEKETIMEIIGREGVIGYRDVPAHDFSAGEQLALTFSLK
jgi:uncharacterized OB-fold protein